MAQGGDDEFFAADFDAADGVGERFGQRQFVGGKVFVGGFVAGITRVVAGERRWRYVVAAAPDMYLLGSDFMGCIGFIEALKGAVMALVEVPVFYDGEPAAVDFIEDDVECVDGAAQVLGEAILRYYA